MIQYFFAAFICCINFAASSALDEAQTHRSVTEFFLFLEIFSQLMKDILTQKCNYFARIIEVDILSLVSNYAMYAIIIKVPILSLVSKYVC